MSDFEDLIKQAFQTGRPDDTGPIDSPSAPIVDLFLKQSRWVAAFAWMKMLGTLSISIVSAICFFLVDTHRAQLACMGLFVVGFVGFGIWWTWYWQVLNRNAALREIKRLELQIAELRGAESASPAPLG